MGTAAPPTPGFEPSVQGSAVVPVANPTPAEMLDNVATPGIPVEVEPPLPGSGNPAVPNPGTAPGPAAEEGVLEEALDSGRVTMRRLNRAEYDNTVRALLGTSQQPGRDFLNDAPQFSFDNNADQLTLSPTQLEMYQAAAESLANEAMLGPAREELVTCDLADGDACVTSIVATFGLRAYRRPLMAEEIAAFTDLAVSASAAGATADEALRTVIEAFLMSPHFLFRVEVDPVPTSLEPHLVGPYEMASRLSYLVYRSMPDEALFEAAAAGLLDEPEELRAQVLRMLGEPEGNTFAQDFVGQWLGTRLLETAQFDTELFPTFGPDLATSMRGETGAFFDEFVRENRPLRELLAADFSYLDENLRRHYGLTEADAVTGLTRSVFATPERGGGFLTMAGPLSVTSYPTRTSLVKRGAWVLEKMLCSEIPPPPPEVDGFPEGPLTATSQRELLEQHRANPSCNACHEVMDNIGVALENYDALGAYRTSDVGQPIDARGAFPNGGAMFEGGPALAAVVADDPRFASCVAEHMLRYALGRSPTAADEPYLEMIVDAGSAAGVRDVLMNIVSSDPFRMRRGEPESQLAVGQTGVQP